MNKTNHHKFNQILPIASIGIMALGGAGQAFGATTWTETGDADEGLFFGDNQEPTGLGPLTEIKGTLGNGNGTWDPSDDHVDAFRITVANVSTFFASLDPDNGGAFVGNGIGDDPALFLFDLGGNLIMANDDNPSNFALTSFLSDPSTFPGTLTNNPGNITVGNDYVLAVTYKANELLDGGGVPLVDFDTTILDLDGINPASLSGVAATWEKPGIADNDYSYTIALGGVTYSAVPEPGSLLSLAVGALALFARRMRN